MNQFSKNFLMVRKFTSETRLRQKFLPLDFFSLDLQVNVSHILIKNSEWTFNYWFALMIQNFFAKDLMNILKPSENFLCIQANK